jgi:hypothetical protein
MMRIVPLCLLFMATACNAAEPKQADDYNEAANKRIDPAPTPAIKEEPIFGEEPTEDTTKNNKVDISDIYYQYDNTFEDIGLNFYNIENKTSESLDGLQNDYTPVILKEGKTVFAYQIFDEGVSSAFSDKFDLEKVTFYRIRFSDVITKEFCVFKYPKIENWREDVNPNGGIYEAANIYLRENIFGYPSKFRCKAFANYNDDPKIKAKLPLLDDVRFGVIDGEPAR